MKKTLICCAILGTFNFAMASDVLTGDKRLACEAILCLSSASKPSECNSAIRKYFSIKARKWHKTIAKRRSFLQLCPVESDDSAFLKLRDNVLLNIKYDCTPEHLNKQNIDYQRSDDGVFRYRTMRISPSLPKFCQDLINHSYTGYHTRPLKYTCSGTFYSTIDFNRGYHLKRIGANEYAKLGSTQREAKSYECGGSESYRTCYRYYKKIFIKKDCWKYKDE